MSCSALSPVHDLMLSQIFNGENILFQKLPELVNRCLAAPDPIILHYMINPTIPAPERPMAWDVELKTEDAALKGRMSVMVQANKESMQNLARIDEEVRNRLFLPQNVTLNLFKDCNSSPVPAQLALEAHLPAVICPRSSTVHTNLARVAVPRP